MLEAENFHLLRPCFVPPILELELAGDLLSLAADALLAGDYAPGTDLLSRADMPVVHAYASRVMGKMDAGIHRYRPVAALTPKPHDCVGFVNACPQHR